MERPVPVICCNAAADTQCLSSAMFKTYISNLSTRYSRWSSQTLLSSTPTWGIQEWWPLPEAWLNQIKTVALIKFPHQKSIFNYCWRVGWSERTWLIKCRFAHSSCVRTCKGKFSFHQSARPIHSNAFLIVKGCVVLKQMKARGWCCAYWWVV